MKIEKYFGKHKRRKPSSGKKEESSKFLSILFGSFILLLVYFNSYGQNQNVADSLINILHKKPDISDSLKWELYINIAFHSSSSLPSQWVIYAQEALKIAKAKGDFHKLAISYRFLGDGYLSQRKSALALEFYYKSLKYFEQDGDEIGKANAWECISRVYVAQKDYEKALIFQNKAILIYQQEQDTLGLAISLHQKGNAFLRRHLPDSSIIYFEESLQLFKKLDFEVGIANSLNNIGEYYHQKGNLIKAEENLQKAIPILKRNGLYTALAYCFITLAEIHSKNNKMEEAFPSVHQSMEIGKSLDDKELISDASLILSRFYSQTKDFENAYLYHTQYIAYRDSINNEETIRQIADLRTEYEVSQKQVEIDLLTRQRQLDYIVLGSLLFILILLGILAFVLYRNNQIRKSGNRILSVQKDKLQQQHNKLEVLNNTKDRFFSIISHDLRGPLNAFNGISESIKAHIARNEMGQLREISEYIDNSARHLSTLLDNLLDWSVQQQGTFPFHPGEVYLNPILNEIVEIFRMTAHSKNIHLNLELEEEIMLWADRNSLMTILRNLLNNALKFTEKNGLVTISAYKHRGYAMINIIDTGVGIPEEKVDLLFYLEEKSINKGTAGEKGLGIGLRLAYEFSKMNKGTIIVNSENGAGTIFTVQIPLSQNPELQKKTATNKQPGNFVER